MKSPEILSYELPKVPLKAGLNKIEIVSYGYDQNNNPIVASKEITIKGVFSSNNELAIVSGRQDLTSTGVTLYGEVFSSGGKSITDKGFFYLKGPNSLNEAPAEVIKVLLGSGTSNFSRKLTGLVSGKKYYYMAYATNADGTVCSEIKEFTTLDEQGITDEINKVIPKEIQEEMRDLGQPIYGGGNPPSIIGTYKFVPCILKKSNFRDSYSVGYQFNDLYITFSEQNNADLTIKVAIDQGGISGEGVGAYIVGEGDQFTVFVEEKYYQNGKYQSTTAEIYSGTITSTGIKNCHGTLVMIDDNGDPENNLIGVGQGRLFYDSDGFSEKVSSSARSASAPTPLLPLMISSRE
jgi:hypothetical protein